jgi:flavin-dependent dehydrogenase
LEPLLRGAKMLRTFANRYDAIIIGGGPAGAVAAITLARAGWTVALIEKRRFPRRKVCGEFISASTFPLFEHIGLLDEFCKRAGPEVRRVGVFASESVGASPMPAVTGPHGKWGRALGREHLDLVMLQAAAAAGADLWQPYCAARIERTKGGWLCVVTRGNTRTSLYGRTIVAASGSWERNSWLPDTAAPHGESDLFAFKAHFDNAELDRDLMPLLVFPGGYGGMVWSDEGRVSLSCCITRRTLNQCRGSGTRAGEAMLQHLLSSCAGVGNALRHAVPRGSWLSAGPIRPGIRAAYANGVFRVGNAAGEAHPIIAEGISMAAQSGWLLGQRLITEQDRVGDESALAKIGHAYASDWRAQFAVRIRAAAVFAHTLIRPQSAAVAISLLKLFPAFVTICASMSGKAKHLSGLTDSRSGGPTCEAACDVSKW